MLSKTTTGVTVGPGGRRRSRGRATVSSVPVVTVVTDVVGSVGGDTILDRTPRPESRRKPWTSNGFGPKGSKES